MKCAYHPERDAIGICVSCGKPICEGCKVDMEEKYFCKPCTEKAFLSKPETGVLTVNSSGQGKLATIPPEIKGWSWGGFFLNWIWGIGNNVWMALLCLIPYFNIVWAFVVGIKGNEWAWRSKKWDSIEHFKRTQRKWAWWGLGVAVVGIIIAATILTYD